MSLVDPKDLLTASNGLNKIAGIKGAQLLMRLLSLNKINKIYEEADDSNGVAFIDSILKSLHIDFEVDERSLQNIPKDGAFIAIANHPLGGIDGLLFLKLLAEVRPDFKIMANFILKKIAPISEYILPVNPFETRPDIKSTAGLKQTIKHLKEGAPIGIFPAGEVASIQKGSHITDKKWSNTALRFIKKANVPVLPIYFEGNNSLLFYLLGKVHPFLRTIKLPSELLNKKNKTIKVVIGNPIPVEEQEQFPDIEKYGRYLRTNTFMLAHKLKKQSDSEEKKTTKQKEIIPAVNVELLKEEIAAIPENLKLYSNKGYHIYCPPSTIIPNTLREIGRLREITFRAIGEGTNNAIDTDEYDVYYHQLFIWDSDENRIVGAYRIGKGKEIMRQYGADGFYLKSLFKITKHFNPILEESLELGRSFIVEDYQRKPLSLFMLWKGILCVLLKNPEYRYLVGPVSISNDYSTISKEMIVKFIMKYHFNYDWAKFVKPRHKFTFSTKNIDTDIVIESVQKDINKLDKYIGQFENEEIRLPVLLKKYISLNAKIIGFNRDPLFNDCLDGLIILDVYDVPDKTLTGLSDEINENLFKDRFEK